MPTSKCMRCDSTNFEREDYKFGLGEVPYVFIQCAKCGGVVGVLTQAATKLSSKLDYCIEVLEHLKRGLGQ